MIDFELVSRDETMVEDLLFSHALIGARASLERNRELTSEALM